jgi:uncharacterized protein (DUF58 family)
MALTGRAALLALLGALPVAAGVPALLVALALLVVVVVDVALAAPLGALLLERDGDSACRLGEPATVRLRVTNGSRRRLHGVLRDAWVPSAGATPRTHDLDIPAGERRVLTTSLLPTRRGDRLPDRVTVRSLGPLRVAARQRSQVAPWRVRVQPAFASRKHLPEKLARLRQLDGAVLMRARGQGTEFDSLREYVMGDDVRSIDWRATARQADVMVRTWRPERDRRVLVVVDTGRTSAGRVGDAPRLDASLDAALLLGALASRAGDRVDLLAFDRDVRASVEGAGRTELLARLVDGLALLEPALVETDGRKLVSEVLRRGRRRSLVVLLTTLEPEAVRAGLLPHVLSLTSRHTLLVGSVSDPKVASLAAGRGAAAEVYGAAAASQAQSERAQVADELTRLGAHVVEAPADRFASAVSDGYLALKAAGRL